LLLIGLGVGLGEYLIKQSVKLLKQEIPSLDTFVTLSPLPNFRKWLEGRANAISHRTKFVPSIKEDLYSALSLELDDVQHLVTSFQCDEKDILVNLIESLDKRTTSNQKELNNGVKSTNHHINGVLDTSSWHNEVVERVLTRLAARYLLLEKHRGKPLDGVARFHISNGAEVYRINFGADLSRKGWSSSFGIMVNYRYNLPFVLSNQEQYESTFFMPVHDDLKDLIT
jgi:malonyl-CoA decarboxylase